MTLHSSVHVPGAFQDDAPAHGFHPDLFRPPIGSPVSPASSSGYLPPVGSRSTTSNANGDNHSKRKRYNEDAPRSRAFPRDIDAYSDRFDQASSYDGTIFNTPAGSRALAAHTYTLAGQLDTTPGGEPLSAAGDDALGESMYSDSNYRRALGSKRRRDEVDSEPAGPTPLFRLPAQGPVSPPRGWGSFAADTLGGVFGRVWHFCRAGGTFKGFYAGGGEGFAVKPPGAGGGGGEWEGGQGPADEEGDDAHRIPGRFPASQFDFERESAFGHMGESSRASTPPRSGVKRRQTEHRDDLGRNWVIVNDARSPTEVSSPRRPPPNRSSPRNRNQGPSMATRRRINTPTGRLSSTPRASLPRQSSYFPDAEDDDIPSPLPQPASSASFAHSRSPSPSKPAAQLAAAAPRLSMSTSHRRHTASAQASPRAGHRRNHSGASAASPRGAAAAAEHHDGDGDATAASPRLDAEARQLAARRQRQDRVADVRISAFNKQLQDMIRQGKEALGTTVEVDGGDGGWEYEE